MKEQLRATFEAEERFLTGENFYAQHFLGIQKTGSLYTFRVWAPNAQQVWLVGDFNQWGDSLPMMRRERSGVWEVETDIPQEGQLYKYKVRQADGREIMKIDPFAIRFEARPGTAAVIHTVPNKKWKDGLWRGRQKRSNHFKRPINIYEVHASSWKHQADGRPYTFKELKEELIPYVKKMNYTHIEFMPLMEHPLGASWGYQLIGFFAVSSYYGTPEEFQDFVEACHLANIGVFIDWVPGHYCANEDTLPYYDGTPTFEYTDPNRAKNNRWGTICFDLGKPQVQSFLLSSALYWIEMFHIDGIRVDAVSSMLYLDYDDGPWTPNHEGGNRNFEGYYFLQKLNAVLKLAHPQVILMAEESTSQTQITGLIETGALGFDYKWNMGWMNDILRFYEMDPLFRKNHFELITFSFMYRHNENYLLALSHDEVVHGKKSLMHKMWGDRSQQFAQLRNLYAFMFAHPGKKLLFMGSEWGQFLEWKYDHGLEWQDLHDELNHKMQQYTQYLNDLYLRERALWEIDYSPTTIEWIDADNTEESILTFIRQGVRKKDFLVVVVNLVPVERQDFVIGVPYEGEYEEIFNTEMAEFGGTWQTHNPIRVTREKETKAFGYQIKTVVPASGVLYLRPKNIQIKKGYRVKSKGGKVDLFTVAMKNEMIAMILAGGQGTRLGKLTKSIAKPAVPFGGRYRIIDFTLSNCANSGINHVGVVTQYEPLALNTHVGNGANWGLNGINSGVTILQPYSSSEGSKWFEGTAHAIYQNIDYIDQLNPQYVLVLSGDHIYKMDYEEMLMEHKKKQASLSVAVLEVPLKEASRFGIMNTDDNNRIIEFEEKPENPKSNLASMGIYIFNWGRLRNILTTNYAKDSTMNDFGKHVIPAYLESGENVIAYRFDGYWKDVGTIDSLWEANMEFLNPEMALDIRDKDWRIYSRNNISPPHFIAETGSAKQSLIADGCYVAGEINHSILSDDVQIKEGAKITDSVIMSGATIGKNVILNRAIIGENAILGDGAILDGTDEIAVVGYSEVIGVTIDED